MRDIGAHPCPDSPPHNRSRAHRTHGSPASYDPLPSDGSIGEAAGTSPRSSYNHSHSRNPAHYAPHPSLTRFGHHAWLLPPRRFYSAPCPSPARDLLVVSLSAPPPAHS